MIVIITYLLKDKITKKADYMALLSGFFGITFGTVCALPYLLIGNLNTFISFIISGFSFDVIHMTGNFIIMLILYEPCRKAIQKLQTRM